MKNFVIVFLLVSLGGSASATDYFVRESGSNKNNGRTPKTAFQTIDFAISKCTSTNDRIYVGGGKHAVTVSRTMRKNQRLEIIGDLNGKKTGDAGRPVFLGKPDKWALNLSSGRSFRISGVQFEGSNGSNYYGLSLGGMTNSAQLFDCVFKNMYMATNFNNNRNIAADSCELDNISYIGLYVRSNDLDIQNCRLTNCRFAVYGQDLKKVTIRKSQFNSDETTSRHAIYMRNCAVGVDSITIAGYDTAIYSINSTSLAVTNSQISNIKSWGIYGSGGKCDISKVTISGKSTSAGYGLSYSGTNNVKPNLVDVNIQSTYCGIRSDGGSQYVFKNVFSSGNRIGYYAYNMAALKLAGVRKGGLLLENNIYGLYVASAVDKPGSFGLADSEISNNDYGLFASGTSVQLDSCIFQKNSRAVYILSAPEAAVSKCEVSDNTARNTWSHFGIRVDAKKISVSDSNILRNDYGLYLTNLSDDAPVLSNLKIDDNKDYGLLVTGGQLRLDSSSNVQVSGSNYGLWTSNSAVTIDAWSGPTASNYPYYLSAGTLDMTGCDIASGVIGIYAHTLKALSLEKCSFQGQSQHGVYAYLPSKLAVESCSVDSSKSHGLYCYSTGLPADAVSINNLSVSNSRIAIRFVGVPISSSNLQNLVLQSNSQGLRVEQASLDLTPELNIEATENQYAVMSINGKLISRGYASAGNAIALYVYRSPSELTDTSLSGTSYGGIFYGSNVAASGLRISTASYGIYYDPQDRPDCTLSIEDSTFDNLGSIAIRAVGRENSKDVVLRNIGITGGRYGLHLSSNKVLAEDIRCTDVKAYAIYASNCHSQFNRLLAERCGSWAVYGSAGTMKLVDSQVYGGQGVLLSTQSSTVVNSIVSGTNYGIYSNRQDGEHSVYNSTIAGIRYDGILANLGKVQVVNSIIQSGRFGINDVSGTNTFHDYNIVTAGRVSFRNTAIQKNELIKQPMFVNAAAGDYRLTAGSPAINAGRDLSQISKRDIVGAARGSFGRFEIGAYEFTESQGSVRILDWDETAE